MTSATVNRVSAPPREPDDDDFMVFSRNLTQAFVDIYTVGDSDIASRGTGDADEKATRQNSTTEVFISLTGGEGICKKNDAT